MSKKVELVFDAFPQPSPQNCCWDEIYRAVSVFATTEYCYIICRKRMMSETSGKLQEFILSLTLTEYYIATIRNMNCYMSF